MRSLFTYILWVFSLMLESEETFHSYGKYSLLCRSWSVLVAFDYVYSAENSSILLRRACFLNFEGNSFFSSNMLIFFHNTF